MTDFIGNFNPCTDRIPSNLQVPTGVLSRVVFKNLDEYTGLGLINFSVLRYCMVSLQWSGFLQSELFPFLQKNIALSSSSSFVDCQFLTIQSYAQTNGAFLFFIATVTIVLHLPEVFPCFIPSPLSKLYRIYISIEYIYNQNISVRGRFLSYVICHTGMSYVPSSFFCERVWVLLPSHSDLVVV